MVTVLEHCRISPPPDVVAENTLPLTFFDIQWLLSNPIDRIFFYDFPKSRTYFTQTIVPNIKNSLSLVLKHFFLFAGNLVTPSNISSSKPKLCYIHGDSVSLTFAECTNDFNHLSGNHVRDADALFPLVPQLPPVTYNASDGCAVAPLFAVQVTLFPNHGITVGFTNHHIVADGNTVFNFIRSWASIAKLSGDAPILLLGGSLLPFYDRNVIQDPKGLDTIFRSQIGWFEQMKFVTQQPPTKKVRATFVIYRADIQGLKNLVSTQRPTLAHVSSFTVVCAFIWSSMAKTRAAIGEEGHEDESEHFGFVIDCRARLDPPIPSTYFGNCLVSCLTTGKSRRLIGEEGFLTAAELIGEVIHTKLHNKEDVLKGAEMWYLDFAEKVKLSTRLVGVAGSPKFDFYNIDFGWGKPKKFEFVSETFSLSGCKDSEGDLEIGLCFPKNEMDAFSTIFAKGIKGLCKNS